MQTSPLCLLHLVLELHPHPVSSSASPDLDSMQKYRDKFISELHIISTKGTKYHWSVTVIYPPPQPPNTANIFILWETQNILKSNLPSVFEDGLWVLSLHFLQFNICGWSHGLPYLSVYQDSPTRLATDSLRSAGTMG